MGENRNDSKKSVVDKMMYTFIGKSVHLNDC